MHLDRITEVIAHFAGLFETTLEQARMRDAYNKFADRSSSGHDAPPIESYSVSVHAPYDLDDFIPSVPYAPQAPTLVEVESYPILSRGWMDLELPARMTLNQFDVLPRVESSWPFKGMSGKPELTIDPPGSVVVAVEQRITLSDRDFTSIGGHGLGYEPVDLDAGTLDAMRALAAPLTPLSDVAMPGTEAEMAAFVTAAPDVLGAVEAFADETGSVSVTKSDTIDGRYADGQLVEELPKFETYRPKEVEETEDDGSTPSVRIGGQGDAAPQTASGHSLEAAGTIAPKSSVTLEAGDNTLENTAYITNDWLATPVMAVAGDHHEVNAIVQVNVCSDVDAVSAALDGWLADEDAVASEAFNVASFARMDLAKPVDAAAVEAGDLPKAWVVTEITGNLVITNWIKQFSFLADGDVSVLSASGCEATVTAGGNTAFNGIDLKEIGYNYDLVIIGGSVYDANLISQLNILLDNDLVGTVAGFGTSGAATASTHGNLLWNQAEIINVGAADRFSALPEAFVKAAADFAGGARDLSEAILADQAFAGLTALRVLYVTGDLINLNYISQTNILGDADQVALAMNAVAPQGAAEWSLATGDNTLVNTAAILDLDSTGKTYVGGTIYSDDILIQAEFMSSDPMLGAQDPNALISEAVVFLGDGLLDDGDGDGGAETIVASLAPDVAHNDVMHTMLA